MGYRIPLSLADVGPEERDLVLEALTSGWVGPVGPHIAAFEEEVAAAVGAAHAVATSSGTAALHLALLLAGVGPGDDVLVPTATFVATANAVTYVGANPVFLDSEPSSWNVDPQLVDEVVRARARRGRLPAAMVTVDLYGQCADYDPILATCRAHGVPVVQDAAEALGATYRGGGAGTQGDLGVLSFNGNKIITSSTGGMLLTASAPVAERARFLATQARDPAVHYEHSQVGFNYRMSNLLAALGRGQLRTLDARVGRRRAVNALYRRALAGCPGVELMPVADRGVPSHWLTCITVDPAVAGASRDEVIQALRARGIEARPTWKPLHLQPLFAGAEVHGGAVSEGTFATGLCLPSGTGLTDDEVAEVASVVTGALAPLASTGGLAPRASTGGRAPGARAGTRPGATP